jgi:VWFA-related protein
VTNVDVVVTDRNGAHVQGLSASDFQLYDNGVLQPITNFSEYRGAALSEIASTAPSPTTEAAAPEVKRPIALLIFVDNLHLQPNTRKRALQAIARFLDAHAGDPLRVVAVRFNGVSRTIPMRGSAREIAAVIPQLFRDSADELVQVRERRRVMNVIDDEPPQPCDFTLRQVIAYAESMRHETLATMDALRATVNSLSGFDGKKVVMFISDGVQQSSGAELFEYWSQKCGGNIGIETMQYDLNQDFRRAADAANAAGVTFYTIDATGVGSEEMAAVDTAHFGGRRLDMALMRDNRRGMLDYLAEATGGVSIKNENVLDAPLNSLGDDFRDYYSLGYRTPAGAKTHTIAVHVRREGLRARARQQYVVTSPEQKIAAQVESMFIVPAADANPMDVVVNAGPSRGPVLPLVIRVPRARLTTIGSGTVWLYVAAMDAAGGATPIRTQSLQIPPTGDLIQRLELTMRAGEHTVVIAIRDDISSTLSLVRLKVRL